MVVVVMMMVVVVPMVRLVVRCRCSGFLRVRASGHGAQQCGYGEDLRHGVVLS